MDKLTEQRIMTMHPKLRAKTLKAYREANNVLGKGVRLRFSQVYRTAEEQDALYAQGRTKPGKRVTNAKAWQSMHCFGKAFDIVLLYDKDNDGNFEEVSWDMRRDGDKDGIPDWIEVTRVLEKHGFRNGFITNGKKWDFPHFQMDFGYNWKQLKAIVESGKIIKETINGKEYIYPII